VDAGGAGDVGVSAGGVAGGDWFVDGIADGTVPAAGDVKLGTAGADGRLDTPASQPAAAIATSTAANTMTVVRELLR
jgi:hypothetical protein